MEAMWGCASQFCGCLVGHVCMGVRISVFAPFIYNNSVSGLDEHADGCRFKKEQIGTLFVWVGALGGGTGRKVWGVGGFLRGVHPKWTCLPKEIPALTVNNRLVSLCSFTVLSVAQPFYFKTTPWAVCFLLAADCSSGMPSASRSHCHRTFRKLHRCIGN